MPTDIDVRALHRSLLHQACWSPASTNRSLLGDSDFALPTFDAGRCFDSSCSEDVAALRTHGVRAVLSRAPNHVVLNRDQAPLDVDLQFLGRNSYFVVGRVAGLSGSFLMLGDDSSVIIAESPVERLGLSAELIGNGPGVYFGPGCTCYGARCTVENHNSIRVGAACLLSDRIDLRASDSHSLVALATGSVVNPPGSITLGPRVWVGTAAVVLKNTTIGTGAVIGAQTVVTRDVPACCVVAGSPARVIRSATSWHRAYPGSLPGYRFRMTQSGMQPYAAHSLEPKGKSPTVQRTVQSSDLVATLYRTLLLRDPDEAGFKAIVQQLEAGETTLDALVQLFLHSEEFGENSQRFRAAYPRAAPTRFTNDMSQFGEVGRLICRWVNQAARHRIVVDVGARGRERSNSYDLMRSFGWRGLLVEANPDLIPTIEAEFAGLDLKLVNCAVSDFEGSAAFHLGVNEDVSSLNEQAARDWGPVAGVHTVQVQRLGALLRAHDIPEDFDLLSLDIEGEDVKVLNDIVDTSDFRPRWIILEASYDYRTHSLDDIPVSDRVKATYSIVDQTAANLILRATGSDAP